jgi:hypothetical protein
MLAVVGLLGVGCHGHMVHFCGTQIGWGKFLDSNFFAAKFVSEEVTLLQKSEIQKRYF